MKPPAAVRRLFPEIRGEDLHQPEATDFILGRLLEEGDTADLRWLCTEIDESRLRAWLSTHGPRQLSRRSYAFWTTALSSPRTDLPDNPLWPL